jgi:hypothetical protein
MEDSTLLEAYSKWRKLLNNRCKDPTEVHSRLNEDAFTEYKVDFLHRTVRDLLRENYMSTLRKDAGENLDARVSLCWILIALIKAVSITTDFVGSGLNQLFGLVDEFLYYARELKRHSRCEVALLDEPDRVGGVHLKGFRNH